MKTRKISFIQFFFEKLAETFRQLAGIATLFIVIEVALGFPLSNNPGNFSIKKLALFIFTSYSLSIVFRLIGLKIKERNRRKTKEND